MQIYEIFANIHKYYVDISIYIVRDTCKSMPDILSGWGGEGVRTGGCTR